MSAMPLLLVAASTAALWAASAVRVDEARGLWTFDPSRPEAGEVECGFAHRVRMLGQLDGLDGLQRMIDDGRGTEWLQLEADRERRLLHGMYVRCVNVVYRWR
jgi:hypothetical protein